MISDLPKDIRRLAKDLKTRHKPITEDEREWVAIVAKYRNGSAAGIKLTSNIINLVKDVDQTTAVGASGIFDWGRPIEKVIHMHTHPDPRNPKAQGLNFIPPGETDFQTYSDLRRQLRKQNPN